MAKKPKKPKKPGGSRKVNNESNTGGLASLASLASFTLAHSQAKQQVPGRTILNDDQAIVHTGGVVAPAPAPHNTSKGKRVDWLKPCPLCMGKDFIHGVNGGYFCKACQPRTGEAVRAGGYRERMSNQ